MLKLLIAVIAVLGLAWALNPKPEAHRDKLSQAMAERSQLAAALHIGDVAAFVSTYHSVGIASYSTLNDRVVTYGAFGVVVAPDQH